MIVLQERLLNASWILADASKGFEINPEESRAIRNGDGGVGACDRVISCFSSPLVEASCGESIKLKEWQIHTRETCFGVSKEIVPKYRCS
jgi:hypothetical protein